MLVFGGVTLTNSVFKKQTFQAVTFSCYSGIVNQSTFVWGGSGSRFGFHLCGFESMESFQILRDAFLLGKVT